MAHIENKYDHVDDVPDEVWKTMSLEEKINLIPGKDGWWKSGSFEGYVHLAKKLITKFNVPEDEADFLLDSAYVSAKACFGG